MPGVVRPIYDPAAGTGGMLSVSGEHLAELNPDARLVMYGQELNPELYAICKADMLINGHSAHLPLIISELPPPYPGVLAEGECDDA